MSVTQCPYTKIALRNNFSWDNNLSLVTVANAQGTISNQQMLNTANGIQSALTGPFYLLIGLFLVFVLLMTYIYLYHFQRFNLGDKFVKGFIPIFLFGLVVTVVPLLFLILK